MSDPVHDFETRAIHGGIGETSDFRATAPVIYPSTTYAYADIAATHAALDPRGEGYAYSRNANPTVRSLEMALASLEETEDAVCFGSGMAAIHAAVLGTGIEQGQTILASNQLYGGSRTLLSSLFARLGFPFEVVNTGDSGTVEQSLQRNRIGLLLFEPISNPLMTVADVEALIQCAHQYRVPVIVDNTFASPYLLRPATLGADLVVESATKYLGGHGDVMAGVVACSAEKAFTVRGIRTASGGILGPFEAWLVLRGLRTLALRVPRQCENAIVLASWLSESRHVLAVHYPGLESDPGYTLTRRMFTEGRAGGMLSFETEFDRPRAEAFLNALRLAVPGTSLGDVETLVLYPPLASHRNLSRDERIELGITDGLLRVSVGLESPKDLIADFEAAFNAVYTPIA